MNVVPLVTRVLEAPALWVEVRSPGVTGGTFTSSAEV
jgi:hypothetical protein